MDAIYEAEAGRLLVLTDRVLKGRLSLDIAMRFRIMVNRSVVYDMLEKADQDRVNQAMKVVSERYKIDTAPTRTVHLASCRRLAS